MKRIIIIVVVLIVVLSAALTIRLRQLQAKSAGPAGGTGTIEGVDVRVTSRVASRIIAIHVDEGDTVHAGQVLVELDCADAEALLLQAKAQLAAAEAGTEVAKAGAEASAANAQAARRAVEATSAQAQSMEASKSSAEKDASRMAALRQAGAVAFSSFDKIQDQLLVVTHQLSGLRASQEVVRSQALAALLSSQAARTQVQSAESGIALARAGVERAEVLVKECKLLAPRDGIVLSRNFEPGEAVMPGTHVLTLVDLHVARATFYLPNAELSAAAPGLKVTIRADAYPDQTFSGTIRHVSPKAEFTPRNVQTREDRDRLVYGVEVSIPNPDGKLRSGMPVEVTIDGTGK